MEIAFTDTALSPLQFWKKAGIKPVQAKIQKLLKAIAQDPYSGIGQPEQLKHEWQGFWSRRITKKDRLIYKIIRNKIIVYALLGHYDGH